jgi:hypothetical protein
MLAKMVEAMLSTILAKRLQIASDNACENAYEKTSKNAYEDNCELF